MSTPGTHIHTSAFLNAQTIGYYTIGGSFHIHLIEKPTKEQQDNMKELLGWIWTGE